MNPILITIVEAQSWNVSILQVSFWWIARWAPFDRLWSSAPRQPGVCGGRGVGVRVRVRGPGAWHKAIKP